MVTAVTDTKSGAFTAKAEQVGSPVHVTAFVVGERARDETSRLSPGGANTKGRVGRR